MKLSIITISYNSEDTIEDTIQSVLRQQIPDLEYIIVDGGSTDKTLEIINKYSDQISTIVSEQDNGLYDAMNKGVDLASGDIVGILNSDDIYGSDDVLSSVLNCFQDEKVDAVYGNLKYVDRVDTNKVKRTWISGKYKRESFKKGWMPPHPSFFVKRSAYTHYGSYNTRFQSSADYDLMLRFLYKHKLNAVYLNKFITLMREGGQSNKSVKNRLAANREDREAWRINGLGSGWVPSIRKPLSKVFQFFRK